MIRLTRSFTPIEMTPAFVASGTAQFQADESNVWNVDWLKKALLELSHYKCAYCECKLQVESKYMEVEHFEDKANNPNKVLNWENLLPACKRCNGAKGTHDVLVSPIVNPFIDTPKDELYFRLYKIKGKTPKGVETEDVININDHLKAVQVRFDIGEELERSLEICEEKLQLYNASSTTQRKNRLLNTFEKILLQCQPDSEYSVTCATVLHSNPIYDKIKVAIITLGFWSAVFQKYHDESLNIVFEMR